MSLATNVTNLATRVATEAKALRTLLNGNAADLSSLTTTAKGNLVAAINEVAAGVAGSSGIDDLTTGTSTTWSSSKIVGYVGDEIDDAVAALPDPGALIDDVTASTSTVYSSTKTGTEIAAAVASLVDGSPGTLDTLNELAAALGDDAAFSTTVTTALGNRVRTDTAAQGLDSTQQGNARTNIAAASAAALAALVTAVGDTDAVFVDTFEAGLV